MASSIMAAATAGVTDSTAMPGSSADICRNDSASSWTSRSFAIPPRLASTYTATTWSLSAPGWRAEMATSKPSRSSWVTRCVPVTALAPTAIAHAGRDGSALASSRSDSGHAT